jgi:hypothetical protein
MIPREYTTPTVSENCFEDKVRERERVLSIDMMSTDSLRTH